MTRTLLHAVAGAALTLTLVGCANVGPYPDGGSVAYDYGYGPWDGVYSDYWEPGVGAFWGPGFYDGGVHHDEWHGWHGGEAWHGGHLAFGGAPHAGPGFGHPMAGGTRMGFAGARGGGFAGGHGGVGRG